MARRSTSSSLSLLVAASLLTLASSAGLPLVGLDAKLLSDGTCATSTVSSGQRFDFNVRDAESEAGHYEVSVKRDVKLNVSGYPPDININISFYFQCACILPHALRGAPPLICARQTKSIPPRYS